MPVTGDLKCKTLTEHAVFGADVETEHHLVSLHHLPNPELTQWSGGTEEVFFKCTLDVFPFSRSP